MSTLNNTTTTTSLVEATTKLAMFGAKGLASAVGGASGYRYRCIRRISRTYKYCSRIDLSTDQ